MQSSTASLAASVLCVLAVSTAVQSLGGRVFDAAGEYKEDKFVTDPSANVEGIFKKEGDMTFIMHSDPLSDDFEDGKETDGEEDSTSGGRKKRNAVLNTRYLWTGAIVPYEISSFFNEGERRTILAAMRHWEEKTCLRFRPKVSTDQYNIFIMTGPVGVCRSFVGRIGAFYQPQGITLGQYCVYFPTIVHELGHAVGFYHEHNRPDRDEHIEVKYNNVQSGLQSAFDKVLPGRTNLLGYGYDYASIMHYSRKAFSKNKQDTIVARDPTIPFGAAGELSPLDIAKANVLYSCGPENTWPPLSTVIPAENALSLPTGITCGQMSNGQTSGTYTSPGYPSHQHNLECAYVIKVPKGYYVQVKLNNFNIEVSTGCTKDYVRIYYGTELTSSNVARFSGSTEGRLCDNRGLTWTYTLFTDVVTVYYRTDGSGGGRGLQVTFTAQDENECQSGGNNCHQCNNFAGGYECVCRDGYYHSAAAKTCYDVNECAYDNAGCQHKCINSGGSYRCECNSGYYLQTDGKSCKTTPPACGQNFTTPSGTFQTPNWPETYPNNIDCEWRIQLPDSNMLVEISCQEEPFGIAGSLPDCKDFLKFYDGHSKQDTEYGPFCHFTKPDTTKMSSNKAMAIFHSGPSHSSTRRGFKCSFRSIAGPTNPPPPPPTASTTTPTTTLRPTTITLTISSSTCGGMISAASGTFQTPNWPETYPNNIDCEWRIQLPDANKVVEISCEEEPFGIAGSLPDCKDFLKFYDGHSKQDTEYGPFCHFTNPDTTKMSSNKAMAVFHSGPSHSSSRRGFKCSFRSVAGPTNPPPPPPTASTTTPTTTLRPTTIATTSRPATIAPTISSSTCGGMISAASGTFQSPNWPETYPNNLDCEWRIQLPDSNKVVEISCEEEPFGIAGSLPACKDFLKFYDGHSKQDTEYGPFCYFTNPDTTKMSSNKAMAVFHSGPSHSSSRRGFKCSFRSVDVAQASQCGGVLTAASGSFQSPNWPQTYPVNVDCTWTITLPDSTKQVEINFDSTFGIAGSLPTCKDKVYVYDDNTGTRYGPYCHFTVPNPPVLTSNRARVVLEAGPSHSSSRVGFSATYRSV